MALPHEVVRLNFAQEVERARVLAKLHGWGWGDDPEKLTIRSTFEASDAEKYILVGSFDDYKAKPPLLDFEDPVTGKVGTPHAYPKSHDSFFNTTGPCICAPFNRKAYSALHGGWRFEDWTKSRESNVDWSNYSTMAGMLTLINTRLTLLDYYRGRMG